MKASAIGRYQKTSKQKRAPILTQYAGGNQSCQCDPVIMGIVRDQVFISYARADQKWKQRLMTHLAPYIRAELLSVWEDKKIRPGAIWRDEIQDAIRRARVAVLLVTPSFLASPFIAENELPPLLDAASQQGLTVLWVAVTPSSYQVTPIEKYQPVNDPARPLGSYIRSPYKLESEMVQVVAAIQRAVESNTSRADYPGPET